MQDNNKGPHRAHDSYSSHRVKQPLPLREVIRIPTRRGWHWSPQIGPRGIQGCTIPSAFHVRRTPPPGKYRLRPPAASPRASPICQHWDGQWRPGPRVQVTPSGHMSGPNQTAAAGAIMEHKPHKSQYTKTWFTHTEWGIKTSKTGNIPLPPELPILIWLATWSGRS